jgi:hypothetical protein
MEFFFNKYRTLGSVQNMKVTALNALKFQLEIVMIMDTILGKAIRCLFY